MIKKVNTIRGFSILEATVVLALMSIVITIITTATNRFGEQLKNSSEINQELNKWIAFRSSLWKEFYESDSLSVLSNELFFYKGENATTYKVENQYLIRMENDVSFNTGFFVDKIFEKEKNGTRVVVVDFNWKGEVLSLSMCRNKDIENDINNYFEKML